MRESKKLKKPNKLKESKKLKEPKKLRETKKLRAHNSDEDKKKVSELLQLFLLPTF